MKKIALMLVMAGMVCTSVTAQISDSAKSTRKAPVKTKKLTPTQDTMKAPGMPYDQGKKNPTNTLNRSKTPRDTTMHKQ